MDRERDRIVVRRRIEHGSLRVGADRDALTVDEALHADVHRRRADAQPLEVDDTRDAAARVEREGHSVGGREVDEGALVGVAAQTDDCVDDQPAAVASVGPARRRQMRIVVRGAAAVAAQIEAARLRRRRREGDAAGDRRVRIGVQCDRRARLGRRDRHGGRARCRGDDAHQRRCGRRRQQQPPDHAVHEALLRGSATARRRRCPRLR